MEFLSLESQNFQCEARKRVTMTGFPRGNLKFFAARVENSSKIVEFLCSNLKFSLRGYKTKFKYFDAFSSRVAKILSNEENPYFDGFCSRAAKI